VRRAPTVKIRLTRVVVALAALVLAIAAAFLYMSWDSQRSTWESGLFLAFGSTLFLSVPLVILTRSIETGLDQVTERQDRIAATQEETASDVARLTEEVAQAQADLRLTRDQLSEVDRDQITANKGRDSELFKSVGEAPSQAEVLNSLLRAKDMGIIPDQGCRVGFISDCYLRFSPGWESTDRVVYESQGPDIVELKLERIDATPLSWLRWRAETATSDIAVSIAESMQASGVYPGDGSFDAGKIFADLSALLILGYESITKGAVNPVRHVIQFCPPQWAVCDSGIRSTQVPYFIRADRLNGERLLVHMSEKTWVDVESFEEAQMAGVALFRSGTLAIKPPGFDEPPF
jgi:hypothetical protein